MASKKFLQLVPNEGFTVLNLGDMEIWDGADMALLRESLTRLIKAEKHRRIGVDMSHVKYIPSGFFGMLFDWYETGVQIRLYAPQPNVRMMLWFNHFFAPVADDCFALAPQAAMNLPMEYPMEQASAGRNGRSDSKKFARAGR
jgi:hypothetical protein